MRNPRRERPAFPGRQAPVKNLSDGRGVSPVIAVILMVAITVVLASVLYVMVIRFIGDEITPDENINMFFREDDETPGKYLGTFEGTKRLDRIQIKIFDSSDDETILLSPDMETYKEGENGVSITYQDVNGNNNLDAIDNLIVNGGAPGDVVSVVGRDSGKTISTATLR